MVANSSRRTRPGHHPIGQPLAWELSSPTCSSLPSLNGLRRLCCGNSRAASRPRPTSRRRKPPRICARSRSVSTTFSAPVGSPASRTEGEHSSCARRSRHSSPRRSDETDRLCVALLPRWSISRRSPQRGWDLQFLRPGPTIFVSTQMGGHRSNGPAPAPGGSVLMQASSSTPPTRRLERTGTPGVYRRGNGYVVVFRDRSGKQHKRAARTLAEARTLKAGLTTDVARGEYRSVSNIRFSDYWPQWIDTYSGRTSRGFRENTRAEYRRDLDRQAAPYFGQMRLAEIEPQHIKRWLSSLAARGLAQSTVRSTFAPVRAMLADAAEEGTIRHNPAAGVRIPSTAKAPEQKRKSLTDDEVERLRAALTSEADRLLVDFLLVTGLRISEAIALNLADIDFGRCRIKVTKRFYRGIDAPKSSFGRRSPDHSRPRWRRGPRGRIGRRRRRPTRCSSHRRERGSTMQTSTTAS